ncbi:hypothetical protein [Streptomyces bullii]|uniref:Uncharacterized protein n=1 Tax=Streptomyces bullii TaxID=349910 RepID=A0ABW0UTJ9_9ACTN
MTDNQSHQPTPPTAPSPTPAPTAEPAPAPTPLAGPQAEGAPEPGLAVGPVPEPGPAPEPTATSAPAPASAAGPAPAPISGPTPAPAPAPAPVAAAPAAPTPLPEPVTTPTPTPVRERLRLRRGRVGVLGTSALLAVAVVAGVGYTVVTVKGADRDAGAAVWEFPKDEARSRTRAGAEGGEKAGGSPLAGMLVPYDTRWGRGPDLGRFGADAALSGEEATALRKEALNGLPRTQRKRLEKAIDRQRITGLAMRSYVSTTDLAPAFTADAFTMRVELARMDNRAAVRDVARFQSEFLAALDVLRKGPKIEGHENAHCFLPPKDSEQDLETMFCSAYVGNVLVTATADGAKPLDTKGAAGLFTEQLDRVSEPGKAV